MYSNDTLSQVQRTIVSTVDNENSQVAATETAGGALLPGTAHGSSFEHAMPTGVHQTSFEPLATTTKKPIVKLNQKLLNSSNEKETSKPDSKVTSAAAFASQGDSSHHDPINI